jgi:hypothetical protein
MILKESLILEIKIGEYSYLDDFSKEFVYADVYKNPNNLNFFEPKVRGISDLKGNLYVINNAKFIRKKLIDFLNRKSIVTNANWDKVNYCYNNVIAWQRKDVENVLYLGESYIASNVINSLNFTTMFNKVKERNPNITFIKKSIIYT